MATSNTSLPPKVKPNRSSEEFCLANMLTGFPRTTSKSKSPSSRSSSAARANSHGSPTFQTPNSSPTPPVLIAIATLPQNKVSKPSETSDEWEDLEQDVDRITTNTGGNIAVIKNVKPVSRNQTIAELTHAIKDTIKPTATVIATILEALSKE